MKAIEVKYLGPNDKTGSRIKAICDGGTLIKPFDYELEIEQNMVWVLGTEYYFLGA